MQILQLEKRLQDQFEVRHALEKALGYRSFPHVDPTETMMPKVVYLTKIAVRICICMLDCVQVIISVSSLDAGVALSHYIALSFCWNLLCQRKREPISWTFSVHE